MNNAKSNSQASEILERILAVLDRQTEIPALQSLSESIKGESKTPDLSNSVIAIDTSLLLKLPSSPKKSDIIDYLTSYHPKPIVLPGQAIQEYWNNILSITETVYTQIAKKHTELLGEVRKQGTSDITALLQVSDSLSVFKSDNEHIFDAGFRSKASSFIEELLPKVLVPYAPRSHFSDLAISRKRSKTPPGFKDEGDGDFLIWVDLLWGLTQIKLNGESFGCVILLTQDTKVDWSRGLIPHPLLSAEIKAILDVDFMILNIDSFAKAIEGLNLQDADSTDVGRKHQT